ncbi:glycosyltransferase family 2 protein [Patescibacteria group bacterium]|nr:glycosyltransferase family 2 protein [Patescibacteria group bacterium]MBU1663376.1 glycosyltransferase family 2 protein [Patescibacteria group bacterium]MBU1934335.1 glycosyltransferase family 2 protein [Patescibacteria group bacterium]MBU2007618.1 glycosyltransferase family 2 protein [Patescibacteria group bacterium]MBU2233373.1 glycosyltransferase family 2 protein [Patescibacteria group bacterium]
MKIFCVIPAFNEEKNITAIINQTRPLVDRLVIVDDGSIDRTADFIEEKTVVLLKHIINRGQGAALRTGTEYCLNNGADIIVHFDADGQFLSQDIERIAAPIKNREAQVVFGSRFLNSEHSAQMPFLKRYFIMPLAKAINKIFFNVDLTDPQSGFRAMSAQAARKISWRQDRFAHCSEIMFEVKNHNFKVKEIPIKVIYHNFGQNFSDGLKILKELFIAMLIN